MDEARTTYRLISKKIILVPVEGKLYRRTEILEEVVTIPDTETIDLTEESEESRPNSPSNCQCEVHRHSTH